MNHQTSSVPQVIPQVAYQSPPAPTQHMTKSLFIDSSFVVFVFSPGDDLIACLNKAMSFPTTVASSRFLSINNQLKTNQATIQDDKVTVQQVQERQRQNYSGTAYKSNATSSRGNTASGEARVVKCYNCQDPGIPAGQAQTIIPHNAAFQTEDLKTYDSDCDDLSTAQAVLMANISNYGSDIISEKNNKTVLMRKKHVALRVIDDEETLILEEESRSKMSEKEKDPEAIKQNISHKPIDYEKLNRLTEDFGKRFTPQQELSAEQAFWLRISNPTIESSYTPPVKVEVPSELPKKRITHDALTEDLLNEITEVQTAFDQMEAAVQQSLVDKQCLEITNKELLLENDQLSQQIMSQDIVLTVMNCMSLNIDSMNMRIQRSESSDKCFNLEAELSKSQNAYKDLLKNYSQLRCISLEATIQLNQEIFQNDKPCDNPDNPDIRKYFEINNLKVEGNNQVFKREEQGKEWKEIVENVAQIPFATTIVPGMFKLDLEPLAPRLLQNRDAHIDYLRNTQEHANILREIVEQAKAKQPLDTELDFACKHATRIQELLIYVRDTCPNAFKPSAKKVAVTPINNVKKVRFAELLTSSSNIKQVESSKTSDSNTPMLSSTGLKCSTSNYGSKPIGNKKNDRISQPPSRNMKNKVEAQPRKVNKKNRVVKPICDVDVKHSLLNANSEIICATCNKSMFDGVHDMCLLDFVKNVKSRAKSAKKHKNQNIWKPTGHVFTEVGLKWKPTGRTSANVVPPKQTTSYSVVI
ncbi:hypothetical protein Tco_0905147 [Tanacetum coccineum]